jgi:predicted GTPase
MRCCVLLLDPTKTQTSVEDTEHGPDNIQYTEHHDGTVDATVKIKAIRIVSGAPASMPLIAAVAELELAIKEWRVAKHSTSDDWKQFVKTRLRVANERVQEAQ